MPRVLDALPASADSAYDQWLTETEAGRTTDDILSKLDERYGNDPAHQVRNALATAKHLTSEQKSGGGMRVP